MNKTVKNSMIYLCGTGIMGFLGFANTIILTRVLPQQVYAMYGLLITFVSAADMFVALGYDQSYMRFFYDHDRSPMAFLWECLKVPLLIFGLFAVMLLEPGQNLIAAVFGGRLEVYVVVLILGQILFSSLHRFTQLTARMGECAGNYVISNIVSKSGFVVLILLFSCVVSEVSFGLVVSSFVVMAIASTGINLVVFGKLGSEKNEQGKEIRNRELLHYGFPYMINNVIILVVPVVEKVIIRNLAGWEVLSIFTAAAVFQTVVMIVSNTLSNIWTPIVYKHCNNEAVFKPILHTFGMVGTMLLTLGTAACILLRRWLVLLLDERYFEVYIIAPAVMLTAFFQILAVIYSVGINIRKKTTHLIVAPLLQISVSVGLCYLLIPRMGLVGVAIAVLVSGGARCCYRIAVGLHYYETGETEIKPALLCVMSILGVGCSLFFTELTADVMVFGCMVLALCLVVNRDIVSIVKTVYPLLGFKKKKDSR